MVWTLERVRKAFFALTIIVLPWQTRWFSEGPSLGGYPWEQGRISVYVSWLLIAAGIILSLAKRLRWFSDTPTVPSVSSTSPVRRSLFSAILAKAGIQYQHSRNKYLFLAVCLLLPVLLHTISPRVTLEWSLECLILLGFLWSIRDLRITRREVVTYLTIALVPHALLGIGQYVSQIVVGSKWLGMATQLPATLGVSIVQVGSERVLRAYGGFPHPNIFGAWLAVGILGIIDQFRQGISRREKIAYTSCLVILLVALVLSFSRAAWLALIVGGLVYLTFFAKQYGRKLFQHHSFFTCLCVGIMTVAVTGFLVRDRIFTRLQPQTRLEQKSLDERTLGIKNGWQVFKNHPLLGSGPGTMNLAITEDSSSPLMEPPVPPHVVPLLVLGEMGSIGIGSLLVMVYILLSKVRREKNSLPQERALLYGFAAFILVLMLLDHFLWSVWSGKVLIALLLLLIFCSNTARLTEESRA